MIIPAKSLGLGSVEEYQESVLETLKPPSVMLNLLRQSSNGLVLPTFSSLCHLIVLICQCSLPRKMFYQESCYWATCRQMGFFHPTS